MRLEFPKNKVELYEIELPEVTGKNRVRTWLNRLFMSENPLTFGRFFG